MIILKIFDTLYQYCSLKWLKYTLLLVMNENTYLLTLCFKRSYLFIFREGEGRKGRKETSMCGCLSCAPYRGPGLQPRHVPWLGIKSAALWLAGPHSVHWTTLAMADFTLINNHYNICISLLLLLLISKNISSLWYFAFFLRILFNHIITDKLNFFCKLLFMSIIHLSIGYVCGFKTKFVSTFHNYSVNQRFTMLAKCYFSNLWFISNFCFNIYLDTVTILFPFVIL